MRTLIENTIPTLAILALPIMFYVGIILGTGISKANERSSTSTLVETVFEFQEEPYIDDIPFNTSIVAEKSGLNSLYNNELNLAERKNIKSFSVNKSSFSIGILNNFSGSGYLF